MNMSETPETTLEAITITGGYVRGADNSLGGGIYISEASPTFHRCIVRQNTASEGGGVYVEGGSPLFQSCVFLGNEAFGLGGGVANIPPGEPTFDHCQFMGNRAHNGGAISGASLHVFSSFFQSNEAASGGAVHVHVPGAENDFIGCVFTGNLATDGGGAFAVGSSRVRLENCTISGNRAGREGGGIEVFFVGPALLERCILFGNCASRGENAYIENDGLIRLTCSLTSSVGIEGPGAIEFLADNVFDDPRFCGPLSCQDAPTTGGDYTLEEGSVCLPAQSPCGQLIGALPEGCASTPVHTSSWGRIKEIYRR
jgi:hypothetical protein